MGYHTDYSLTIEPATETEVIRQRAQVIFTEHSDASHLFKSSDLELYDEKWYECDSDILKISEEFPSVTFVLSGRGEDRDDVWRRTFHGGMIISETSSCLIENADAERLQLVDGFFQRIVDSELRQHHTNLQLAIESCYPALKEHLVELQKLITDLAETAAEAYGKDCLPSGAKAAHGKDNGSSPEIKWEDVA